MGIRFACHHCQHPMHVKDFLAGKRGRCPECNQSFRVPLENAEFSLPPERSTATDEESESKVSAPEPSGSAILAEPEQKAVAAQVAPQAVAGAVVESPVETPVVAPVETVKLWFVRHPSGGEYGPAPDDLLRAWIAEKRVTADSYVWADGMSNWMLASQVFSELFGAPVEAVAAKVAAEVVPRATRPVSAPSSPTRKAAPELLKKRESRTTSKSDATKLQRSSAAESMRSSGSPLFPELPGVSNKPIEEFANADLDMGVFDFGNPVTPGKASIVDDNFGSAAEIKAKRRQQQKAMQMKIIAALLVVSLVLLTALIVVLLRSGSKPATNEAVPASGSPELKVAPPVSVPEVSPEPSALKNQDSTEVETATPFGGNADDLTSSDKEVRGEDGAHPAGGAQPTKGEQTDPTDLEIGDLEIGLDSLAQ